MSQKHNGVFHKTHLCHILMCLPKKKKKITDAMISLPQSFSVDKNRNIQSVVNFSAAVIVLYALDAVLLFLPN